MASAKAPEIKQTGIPEFYQLKCGNKHSTSDYF